MKSRTTAGVVALCLGGLGGHKFYLGQPVMGLAYLCMCWTFIPSIAAFIEAIMFFTMSDAVFNVKYNAAYIQYGTAAPQVSNQNTMAQNIVVNIPSAAGHGALQQLDTASQLAKLNDLRVSGALSDEEFQLEKRKLLASAV